jgi:hypothetical protein
LLAIALSCSMLVTVFAWNMTPQVLSNHCDVLLCVVLVMQRDFVLCCTSPCPFVQFSRCRSVIMIYCIRLICSMVPWCSCTLALWR